MPLSFHLALFFISSVGHEYELAFAGNLFMFRIILSETVISD